MEWCCPAGHLPQPSQECKCRRAELRVSDALGEDIPYRKPMCAVTTMRVVNQADLRVLTPMTAYLADGLTVSNVTTFATTRMATSSQVTLLLIEG